MIPLTTIRMHIVGGARSAACGPIEAKDEKMTKTKVQSITAVQHPSMYQPPIGCPCWYTIRDAAAAMGVSVSTVRRAVARQTDVRVIHGRSVAGMVELQCGHSRGYMPYHE